MNDCYHNRDLAARMAGIGPVDRFIRSICNTYEHVISLSVQTAADGMTRRCVSVDVVGSDGVAALSVVLGIYRMGEGMAALQDADQVATTLGLVLRVSDVCGGWQTAYDPDGALLIFSVDDDDARA